MDASFALNAKTAAALCGLAEATLRQARVRTARSARVDLLVPPHRPQATPHARVVYDLGELVEWAAAVRKPLRWDRLPLRLALPAADLHAARGVPLPDALAALAQRVVLPGVLPAGVRRP